MKFKLFILALSFASTALAGEMHGPAKVSPEFEKMKALIGTWEGKTKMHTQKEETTIVTYELTSGGTAIVEKLAVGTPHEMTTVYANRGDKVYATHFCAMGNQPEMSLKKAAGNTWAFEMDGTKGISNANENHMHALTIKLDGKNLTQEWTNFANNKKADTATFNFTKKM